MACPVCKFKKTNLSIEVKDFEYDINKSATYKQCKYCFSLYRTNPKSIENLKKKNYPKKKYLPLTGSIFYDFFKSIYAKYEMKIILSTLNFRYFYKKFIVLDIACGKGFLIKRFSKYSNFICFGSDLNIKTRKIDKVTFIKSKYNNLLLIKKLKPDLIIINNFIEHIENYKGINSIIKCMKKNSSLAIITPDADSQGRSFFKSYWSGYHAPRHKVIFTSKGIKKLFYKNKRINFSQVKIYDPFTNLMSIFNLFKDLKYNFLISKFIKIFLSFLYTFYNLRTKNKILLVAKKF